MKTSKILWDFPIQTDQMLEHNRLEMMVVDKVIHMSYIVDRTFHFDSRTVKKEDEKVDKHNRLSTK